MVSMERWDTYLFHVASSLHEFVQKLEIFIQRRDGIVDNITSLISQQGDEVTASCRVLVTPPSRLEHVVHSPGDLVAHAGGSVADVGCVTR